MYSLPSLAVFAHEPSYTYVHASMQPPTSALRHNVHIAYALSHQMCPSDRLLSQISFLDDQTEDDLMVEVNFRVGAKGNDVEFPFHLASRSFQFARRPSIANN